MEAKWRPNLSLDDHVRSFQVVTGFPLVLQDILVYYMKQVEIYKKVGEVE